jgi:hypothetical protein
MMRFAVEMPIQNGGPIAAGGAMAKFAPVKK